MSSGQYSALELGGFVLAGGRSSRMGTDKALLTLEGETLVERAVHQLGRFCRQVTIAGGSTQLACYGQQLPDQSPGSGPLSGIVTALEMTSFEWNLFVAVDTPFIPDEVWSGIAAWISQSGDSPECSAVMARSGMENPEGTGHLQPLCAAYRRSAASSFRSELESGPGKVTRAAHAAGVVYLVDFENEAWFRNINTPDDLGGTGILRGRSAA